MKNKWGKTGIISQMQRLFPVCLCLLCSLFCFSGCSRKETGMVGEEEETAVTLNLYTWKDEESYMKELASRYMENHEGITVSVHAIPTYEYRQSLEIVFNGSKPIDVFASSKPSIGIINQDKGYSLDLTPYMKVEDTGGYGEWFEDLKQDERVSMLPYRMSSWVVYYNKKIFDEFKIPYPKEGWTWEDYTETARQLTRNTADGRQIYGSMSFDLNGTWWRTPARTTGRENPLDREGLLQLKRAAEWSYQMAYEYQAQPKYTEFTSVDSQDYNREFLEGNSGMYFNGEWCLTVLNSAVEQNGLDFEYDVAPMPHWAGEEEYAVATAAVMQVAAKSEHPKEAVDLLKYLCGKEGAAVLAEKSLIPAWNSPEIRQIFTDSLIMPEHAGYFFSDKKISQIVADRDYEESLDIVKKYVNQYLLQEISSEQAFRSIEQEFAEKGLKRKK